MIFGIPYISWIGAISIIILFVWTIFLIGYLLGIKKEPVVSPYFNAMFNGLEQSELRVFWKYLVFSIEYFIGIIVATFVKSAWYPALGLRVAIGFILFGDKRKERIIKERLKDDISSEN